MSVTMIDTATGERVAIAVDDLANGRVLHRHLPDGTELEVCDLDPHLLRVDGEYQRALSMERARKYARQWSYIKAIMLTVSRRGDNDYVVIDGQHRLAAALEAGVAAVPCLVLYGLSRAAEAALFAALSTERVSLSARDKFRARLVAGDPVCAAIQQAVTECGYSLNLGERRKKDPKQIDAVAHLETVYARGLYPRPTGHHHEPVSPAEGMAAVRRVLLTITACWPNQVAARRSVVIEALGVFWQYHGADVSIEHLVEKLRLTAAAELVRRAHGYRETMGGSEVLWFAHALVECYNARKTSRRLPQRMPLPGVTPASTEATHG